MLYKYTYISPFGNILIVSNDNSLTGLWFETSKYYPKNIDNYIEEDIPIIKQTICWLDLYFSGHNPQFKINIELNGTDFQKEVWNILLEIPYGSTSTYSDIANIIAKRRNIKKMSSQAVGHSISRNPISIIVPCHRVIGKNKALVGYANGLEIKEKLLELEKKN